jgi:hypothetical protein
MLPRCREGGRLKSFGNFTVMQSIVPEPYRVVFHSKSTVICNKKRLTGGAKWGEVGQNGKYGLIWEDQKQVCLWANIATIWMKRGA